MARQTYGGIALYLTLVVAVALGCTWDRNIVYGPLTLRQLQSIDDVDLLEGIGRLDTQADDPAVRAQLTRILANKNRPLIVRAFAAIATSKAPQEAFSSTQDVNLKILLAIVLAQGESNNKETLTFFVRVLRNPREDPILRWVVARSLFSSKLRESEVLECAFALAADPAETPSIRKIALSALAHVSAEPEAESLLFEALDQGDPDFQLVSASALSLLYRKGTLSPSASQRLLRLALKEGLSPDVVVTALSAIGGANLPPEGLARAQELYANPLISSGIRQLAGDILGEAASSPADLMATHLGLVLSSTQPIKLRSTALRLIRSLTEKGSRSLSQLEIHQLTGLATNASEPAEFRTSLLNLFSAALKKSTLASGHDVLSAIQQILSAPETEIQQLLSAPQGTEPKLLEATLSTLVQLCKTSNEARQFSIAKVQDRKTPAKLRAMLLLQLSRGLPPDPPFWRSLLEDPTEEDSVRAAAAGAFSTLGTEGRKYRSHLLRLLTHPNDESLSPTLEQAVLRALNDCHIKGQDVAAAAAQALVHWKPSFNYELSSAVVNLLRDLGKDGPAALPILVASLEHDPQRWTVATGNGREDTIDLDARQGPLGDAPVRVARQSMTMALEIISVQAQDHDQVDAIPMLKRALAASERLQLPTTTLNRAIRGLENAWFALLASGTLAFLGQHEVLTAGLLYLLVTLVMGLLLLVSVPRSLAWLNVSTAGWVSFTIPFTHMTLSPRALCGGMAILWNHHRAIDAWVGATASAARDGFSRLEPVRLRQIHVPVPGIVEDQTVPAVTRAAIAPLVRRGKFLIAIEGEGGAGKSSLAFQIACWALAEATDVRLGKWLMLPVLIDFNLPEKEGAFLRAVNQQVSAYAGVLEPLPDPFVRHLLASGRILVIADRVSELDEKTRAILREAVGAIPVAAMVVTSRRGDSWDGTGVSRVRPVRIEGNYASSFLNDYLQARGERRLFDDEAFFTMCKNLSAVTRGRELTPLLATMYADESISLRRMGTDAPPGPESIPALMSSYVDKIRAGVETELTGEEIHAALRLIAWQCVQEHFRPASAQMDTVRAALMNGLATPETRAGADAKLDVIVRQLKLAQITGLGQDQIRFALDPLAEYLAAIYLIHRADPQLWDSVLLRLRTAVADPVARPYLGIIIDCITHSGLKERVPQQVVDQLHELSAT